MKQAESPVNLSVAQAGAAMADPDAPALIFPDREFTRDQMRALGAAFATQMERSGIGSGALVHLKTRDVTVIAATMLGASRLGARVVHIEDTVGLHEKMAISHELILPGEVALSQGTRVEVSPDWSPAQTFETDVRPSDADAPWLYVHTSGTTGAPKFVTLSQRVVVARSRAVLDDFPPGGRVVLLYPAGTRPWLARAAAALVNGCTLMCEFSPTNWADMGISLVSGARPQFRAMLATGQTIRLARAEVIGARLAQSDAQIFLRRFETVDDTYGSSETSKCYSTLWRMGATGAEAVSQFRDSEIELVDSENRPVPPETDGIVRIRNSYSVSHYVGKELATNGTFSGGWFYPGDVAALDASGRLLFHNRMDHVINIAGEKTNAVAVDMIFKATKGIRDAIVFRNPKLGAIDELFAFVVFEDHANRLQAIESAKYTIAERLGEGLVPRLIRPVAGIPYRQDGRPDRQKCADLILSVSAKASEREDLA